MAVGGEGVCQPLRRVPPSIPFPCGAPDGFVDVRERGRSPRALQPPAPEPQVTFVPDSSVTELIPLSESKVWRSFRPAGWLSASLLQRWAPAPGDHRPGRPQRLSSFSWRYSWFGSPSELSSLLQIRPTSSEKAFGPHPAAPFCSFVPFIVSLFKNTFLFISAESFSSSSFSSS